MLEKFLKSEQSTFEVKSLHDFLHSMSLIGFYRHAQPEKEQKFLCFRFWNQHFKAYCDLPDDLYKLEATNIPKAIGRGAKRMLTIQTVHFLQRLASLLSSQDLKISKLELAQMKLHFALQQELDFIREQAEEIEFVVDEPEYMKNNEIAGYYGDVQIDPLRNAFGEFFPTYSSTQDDSIDVDMGNEPTIVESTRFTSTPLEKSFFDEEFGMQEEIATEVKHEDIKPSAPKKPKYSRPMFSHKETEEALEFMFRESKAKNEE